jgi:predicted nucleic acid-binding protein
MNKVRLYLDTSVISYLQTEDTLEKNEDTLNFWQLLKKGLYRVVISDLTIAELTQCPEPKRSVLLAYLGEINYEVFPETLESIKLADKYIEHGVLNSKSRDDCRHIAIATLSNCKYIISWNFKHFVNIKTINKVQAINKLLDYQELNILPPSMMIEGDEH